MNKKILILALLFLISCANGSNMNSPKLLFNKSYAFADTYMINQEVEMKWLQDNFDNINFDNAKYVYSSSGALVEKNIDKCKTYEELVTKMIKYDSEITHANISATATFEVEEYKAGSATCHYVNFLKSPQSNDFLIGDFELTADKDTEVGTSLSGIGQMLIDEKVFPSEIKLSVAECKNDKITCVSLKIYSGSGGTDNSYKYIFPLKGGNEDHIIQCYSNFLPTES